MHVPFESAPDFSQAEGTESSGLSERHSPRRSVSPEFLVYFSEHRVKSLVLLSPGGNPRIVKIRCDTLYTEIEIEIEIEEEAFSAREDKG
jgi:hypothetical protein